jgi:XTP/dITP diphosphohydrolase
MNKIKIVFATNNINKLSEIRDLVTENIEILSLKDINCFDDLPVI